MLTSEFTWDWILTDLNHTWVQLARTYTMPEALCGKFEYPLKYDILHCYTCLTVPWETDTERRKIKPTAEASVSPPFFGCSSFPLRIPWGRVRSRSDGKLWVLIEKPQHREGILSGTVFDTLHTGGRRGESRILRVLDGWMTPRAGERKRLRVTEEKARETCKGKVSLETGVVREASL